jgi:hypothetical protein
VSKLRWSSLTRSFMVVSTLILSRSHDQLSCRNAVPVWLGAPRSWPGWMRRPAKANTLKAAWQSSAGQPGAGKTALAQHWGHRVGSSFPDGHLWLDLGGDEAQRRMTPQAAIQHMLYALGIPPRQLLGDEQELTALFRTTLSPDPPRIY